MPGKIFWANAPKKHLSECSTIVRTPETQSTCLSAMAQCGTLSCISLKYIYIFRNKLTSCALLLVYSQGGNFIDTAVNYQFGESEQWIGEWMEARGNRDEMVIATKFAGGQRSHEQGVIQSNFGGNSAKNIHTSVERSLKNLRTSYIDLVCYSPHM